MNYHRLKVTLLIVATLLANWAIQEGRGAIAWASGLGQDAPPPAVASAAAAMTIPATFNYQGYVRNPDGTLMTGTHTVRARFYKDATGGGALHDETQATIPVRDGLFNIVLGVQQNNPFPPTLFLENAPLYLGITLDNSPTELIPRQRLHAVPWALTASALTPNATVNGLTNIGPTTLNGATTLNGLTATGPVALNADVTVNAIREIGDAAGNKTSVPYNMSLRRYTLEAQDSVNMNAVPVDDAILQQLCADEDGCLVYLGMRDWAGYQGTGVVARLGPIRFSLGKVEGNGQRKWYSEGDDINGARFYIDGGDKNDDTQAVVNAWGCNFTDHRFTNNGTGVILDQELGFFLSNNLTAFTNPEMTCVLTIDD